MPQRESFLAVAVPQGTPWPALDPGLRLPPEVHAALEAARGALIRTVYHLSDGDRWVAAIGYHRPATAQEKLTAISGEPALFGRLSRRVAELAEEAGWISLKVELPAEATDWLAAVREAGFETMRAPASAAPLPAESSRVPLGLVLRLGGWRVPELAYYRQTTDFTCGPVAALTATHGLGLTGALDRATELELWREATSAPGCDPYGLAAALARRDIVPEVVVSTERALQVELEPAEWQRDLREFLQADFRARAEADGVRFQLRDFELDEVFALLHDGRMVLLLIDEQLMHAEACPHWVVVHGVHDSVALVEDPWTDHELGETWVDAHQLAVTAEGLAAMTGWGDPPYRSMLVL